MDTKTCLNIAAKNNAPLDISKTCDAAKLVQGWAGLGWAGLVCGAGANIKNSPLSLKTARGGGGGGRRRVPPPTPSPRLRHFQSDDARSFAEGASLSEAGS